MTASIKASADGLSAIIQVGGADKVTVGVNGIAAGSFAPQSITPNDLAQKLTLGTSVASTSGTAIDFTGIPSWAKRITVMFNGVSTSGTSPVQIQLGAGSIQTTGYLGNVSGMASTVNTNSHTTGFPLSTTTNSNATASFHGCFYIVNVSGNIWVCSGVLSDVGNTVGIRQAGQISLSGTLDRLRLTTVNGTDTFDAGSINILYEG